MELGHERLESVASFYPTMKRAAFAAEQSFGILVYSCRCFRLCIGRAWIQSVAIWSEQGIEKLVDIIHEPCFIRLTLETAVDF